MGLLITVDSITQLYDWLCKSIGMFVQHAHNEVKIVKKFYFINKSNITM